MALCMLANAPSRAWSCATLQSGMALVRKMPLNLDSFADDDVEGMERELERLKAS